MKSLQTTLLIISCLVFIEAAAQAPDGKETYDRRCIGCHEMPPSFKNVSLKTGSDLKNLHENLPEKKSEPRLRSVPAISAQDWDAAANYIKSKK